MSQRRDPRGALVQLALAVALAGACGCAGSFGAGVRAYDHGQYPEALEHFREAEENATTQRGEARARYALYRGLAHLALGDRVATLRWLRRARDAVQAEPTLLADEDLGRLASAWAHLQGN